jgi:hypothetical protein
MTLTVRTFGFTCVADFQLAYNHGTWLNVDGVQGPKTTQALEVVQQNGGYISPHFRASEFACRCCKRVKVHRGLLQSLERLRAHYNDRPITIVSGYRCHSHNKKEGGAPFSQHLSGRAADLNLIYRTSEVISLHLFAGIGQAVDSTGTLRVRHVDRRDLDPVNRNSRATRFNPDRWTY